MDAAALGRRFLESTRGQIISLLRRGERTVEELAVALALTDNAIRNHLSALERDGLVRQLGVRRRPGAGKPAVLYELHPDTAPLLSRAYPPVLGAVVDVLVDELPHDRAEELLRKVGRRLAKRTGGTAQGTLAARTHAAAGVLEALGGDVEVTESEGAQWIRGSGCPLSAVVCHRPEVCTAVEAMITEIAGAPAQSHCEHGEKPKCRFAVTPAG